MNHSDDFLRGHICVVVNRRGGSHQQVRLQLHSRQNAIHDHVVDRQTGGFDELCSGTGSIKLLLHGDGVRLHR